MQSRPDSNPPAAREQQATQGTQSDYSLSRDEEKDKEEGSPFSVAEEVSFDEQSEQARHVGQAADTTEEEIPEERASLPEARDKLERSIERSVPPSA